VTTSRARIAFLFDVDNTLLDNDRVKSEMAVGIERVAGKALGDRFWELYEDVRRERDYVDLPATVARFGDEVGSEIRGRVLDLVMGYPFETALYPGAMEALAHVQTFGPAAIVTDGDPIYQPAKIARAGITEAVSGRVFVYTHKEHHLLEVQEALPAHRYVLVDDKLSILADVEDMHGHVVTVHVRQGHYADVTEGFPPPDRTLEGIGELADIDLGEFLSDGGGTS
jgi:FMN phosphatase YigB (HAD superfamily)